MKRRTKSQEWRVSRRGFIEAGATAAIGIGGAASIAVRASRAATGPIADPMKPIPIPPQVPVKEGLADLGDTKLWYWDTGGDGPTIVLLHPASGTSLVWGYQQPVLAAAGYRVVAYSRRGYYKSDPVPKDNPGYGSEDMHHLIDHLGIRKFHIVATAAGASFALDYALSHSDRVLSMVLSSAAGGNVQDADFAKMNKALAPPHYDQMPTWFKELGPSYRAANPDGTKAWADLESKAVTGNRFGTKLANELTWPKFESLLVPTLLIAGDADLDAPPSIVREYAKHIPNSEFVSVAESGHSVYWEQPEVFNRLVLDFVGKHKA
jgi:pimeloyl-ACP methyl ester carboxylesterase